MDATTVALVAFPKNAVTNGGTIHTAAEVEGFQIAENKMVGTVTGDLANGFGLHRGLMLQT